MGVRYKQPGKTDICNLASHVLAQQDVLALDIQVDDPIAVQIEQSLRYLHCKALAPASFA